MYNSPKATKNMDLDYNMAPQKPDFSQMNFTSCFASNANEEMAPIKNGVNAFSLFGSKIIDSDDLLKNTEG